jgi:hypothetical protein
MAKSAASAIWVQKSQDFRANTLIMALVMDIARLKIITYRAIKRYVMLHNVPLPQHPPPDVRKVTLHYFTLIPVLWT